MKQAIIYTIVIALVTLIGVSCTNFVELDGPNEPPVDYSASGTIAGHDYVDLGLSVMWATCNVGASKPEDYGSYFAWGEAETKTDYSWSTYKYGSSWTSLTKYNTSSAYGKTDYKTTLELFDDAARANWSGTWRMPTYSELSELVSNCSWTWITKNGVNGYKVTSKNNGKSIFLPAAGYRLDSSLHYDGSYGYYWSSSLDSESYLAKNLDSNEYTKFMSFCNRQYGLPVRPVSGEDSGTR